MELVFNSIRAKWTKPLLSIDFLMTANLYHEFMIWKSEFCHIFPNIGVFDIHQIFFETLFFLENGVCSKFTSFTIDFWECFLMENIRKALKQFSVNKRRLSCIVPVVKVNPILHGLFSGFFVLPQAHENIEWNETPGSLHKRFQSG